MPTTPASPRRHAGVMVVLLGLVSGCGGVAPDPSATPPLTPSPGSSTGARPSPASSSPDGPATSRTIEPAQSPTPVGSAAAGDVELVLYNGPILTVDPGFAVTSAVAIAGGRIVATGSDETIRALAGSQTRLIDLEGRAVMPGIVDPHLHLLQHEAHSGVEVLEGVEQLLIENGRTTVGVPGLQSDALAPLQDFGASGMSRLRVHLYLAYNDFCDSELGHWYRDLDFSRDPSERMAIAGIKLFYDGGACDAPAVTFDWDTHRWSGRGDLFVDAAEVAEIITTADSIGAQVVAHSAGDLALDSGLEGLELALAGRPNVNRHRIDHVMFARPDQLDRFDRLGVQPVLFGTHQSCVDSEDSSVVRYLDDERLRWLEPRRQIIDANPNLPVGWHSDAPHLPLSMFENLAALTGLGEALGRPGSCVSDILVEHQVTSQEAVTMMTLGGAYAMQLESAVGSLEPGKAADLVIIARNPMELDGVEHLDNSVVATIIAGRFEWCDPQQATFCGDGLGRSAPPTQPPIGSGEATASAALEGRGPDRAVDGDLEVGWMAGSDAPQWIELDLGSVSYVDALRLHVDQDPAGSTRHVIYGGADPAPTAQLAVIEGETSYGDVLEVAIGADVRFLRVETVDSPSWVGWLEIEVTDAP